MQHQEIIVQQPCPPPNGTQVLVDYQLLPQDHKLDPTDTYDQTTTIALLIASLFIFFVTFLVFVCNCRNIFCKKQKKAFKDRV